MTVGINKKRFYELGRWFYWGRSLAVEEWSVQFLLAAIIMAGSLYFWLETGETGLLFVFASSLMYSLFWVCISVEYYTLSWFLLTWSSLIAAVIFMIIGVPGALRVYRGLTREYALKSRKGLPRFLVKLAKKYGPVKAVLLTSIITDAICFAVLFPVIITFSSFTLIESFLIVIFSGIPPSIIVGRFLHRLLVETLKQDRESEDDSQRETATTGDESGEVDIQEAADILRSDLDHRDYC